MAARRPLPVPAAAPGCAPPATDRGSPARTSTRSPPTAGWRR